MDRDIFPEIHQIGNVINVLDLEYDDKSHISNVIKNKERREINKDEHYAKSREDVIKYKYRKNQLFKLREKEVKL